MSKERVLVPALAASLFVLAFALAHWVDGLWLQQDDAYITYQYARRIAAGHGFSYSPGAPPSYGTTTPLWTLVLALFARLGLAPHIAAPWLTAALHAATAACALLLGVRAGWLMGGVLGGLLYTLALGVFFRTGGMETALVTALTALLALSLLRGARHYTAGILVGLLLLARPDAGILGVLVFGAWLLRRGCFALLRWSFVAAFLAYAPWAIYALATFGDLVPSSLRARMAVHGFSGHMGAKPFIARFFGGPTGLPFLALALAFGTLGGVVVCWKKPRLRPFVAWIPVYYLVLHLGQAPDFSWYYVPPLWLGLLLVGIGVERAARVLPPKPRWLAFVGCSALLLLLFGQAQRHSIRQLFRPDFLEFHYELAQAAKRVSKPGDVIAAMEIGHLAYWSDRSIVDMLSLVSPEVRPRAVRHHWDAMIRARKPEFVVVYDMDHLPELQRVYQDVHRLRTWTGKDYAIWRRQQHPDQ